MEGPYMSGYTAAADAPLAHPPSHFPFPVVY